MRVSFEQDLIIQDLSNVSISTNIDSFQLYQDIISKLDWFNDAETLIVKNHRLYIINNVLKTEKTLLDFSTPEELDRYLYEYIPVAYYYTEITNCTAETYKFKFANKSWKVADCKLDFGILFKQINFKHIELIYKTNFSQYSKFKHKVIQYLKENPNINLETLSLQFKVYFQHKHVYDYFSIYLDELNFEWFNFFTGNLNQLKLTKLIFKNLSKNLEIEDEDIFNLVQEYVSLPKVISLLSKDHKFFKYFQDFRTVEQVTEAIKYLSIDKDYNFYNNLSTRNLKFKLISEKFVVVQVLNHLGFKDLQISTWCVSGEDHFSRYVKFYSKFIVVINIPEKVYYGLTMTKIFNKILYSYNSKNHSEQMTHISLKTDLNNFNKIVKIF